MPEPMTEPGPVQELASIRPAELVRPLSTEELVAAHKAWVAVIQDVLEPGRDYGIVPGTDRPTLFKPGAERIALAGRFKPDFEIVEAEVDHDREIRWKKRDRDGRPREGVSLGVYRYVVRCRLIRRETGEVVGDGLGAASTLESKYVDRPRDVENTILKMAEKRAFVGAILTTLGLSDRFEGDAEHVDVEKRRRRAAPRPGAESVPPAAGADGYISSAQLRLLWAKLHGRFPQAQVNHVEAALKRDFGIDSLGKIPGERFETVLAWIDDEAAGSA